MTIDAEERELILAGIDRLVQERIVPRAAEIDASNQFPSDLYAAVAELGLLGLWIPEEYGGTGPDLLTPLLISERFARVSPSFSLVFSNCGDAVTPIVHAAPEHLKREWLPRIVSGEVIPCFSLSEPGAGSDAASIVTRAERRGDEYVINGRKCWCTNGSVGGVYVLFAKTDPEARHKGVSAFLVPRDTPGLSMGRDEDLIGLRAARPRSSISTMHASRGSSSRQRGRGIQDRHDHPGRGEAELCCDGGGCCYRRGGTCARPCARSRAVRQADNRASGLAVSVG